MIPFTVSGNGDRTVKRERHDVWERMDLHISRDDPDGPVVEMRFFADSANSSSTHSRRRFATFAEAEQFVRDYRLE